MQTVLGIDTGGTYTDAVLLEQKTKKVLKKAKSPTTRDNLAVGIGKSIRGLGLDDLPVVGLAKREEEIFKPHQSESIMLDREGAALHLIQRIRDEAHRFAITYHRQLRGRHSVSSALSTVPGIGDKRRRALLTHFKSVEALRAASLEEIAAVPGMSRPAAENVWNFLHPGD